MTGNIPPTGPIGQEFIGPIGNEQPTYDQKLPHELSQAQKNDPVAFRKSTGLPQEADRAVVTNQALSFVGLRDD